MVNDVTYTVTFPTKKAYRAFCATLCASTWQDTTANEGQLDGKKTYHADYTRTPHNAARTYQEECELFALGIFPKMPQPHLREIERWCAARRAENAAEMRRMMSLPGWTMRPAMSQVFNTHGGK